MSTGPHISSPKRLGSFQRELNTSSQYLQIVGVWEQVAENIWT